MRTRPDAYQIEPGASGTLLGSTFAGVADWLDPTDLNLVAVSTASAQHGNVPVWTASGWVASGAVATGGSSASGGLTFDDADPRYVNASGDTMTGQLYLKNDFYIAPLMRFRFGDTDTTVFSHDAIRWYSGDAVNNGVRVKLGPDLGNLRYTGSAGGSNQLLLPRDPFWADAAVRLSYMSSAIASAFAASGGITLADADARYVNVSGDTIASGSLTIQSDAVGNGGELYLERAIGPRIFFRRNNDNASRFEMGVGISGLFSPYDFSLNSLGSGGDPFLVASGGGDRSMRLGMASGIVDVRGRGITFSASAAVFAGSANVAHHITLGAAPVASGHAVRLIDLQNATASAGMTQASADGLYVNATGDTMTGKLLMGSASIDIYGPGDHAISVKSQGNEHPAMFVTTYGGFQWHDPAVGFTHEHHPQLTLSPSVFQGSNAQGLQITAGASAAHFINNHLPTSSNHLTNRAYVDQEINTRMLATASADFAPTNHGHAASTVTVASSSTLPRTNVQTALDYLAASAGITLADADARYVNASGDTMSGALAMGSQKITGLAAATLPGDAVRFEQAIKTSGNHSMSGYLISNSSSIGFRALGSGGTFAQVDGSGLSVGSASTVEGTIHRAPGASGALATFEVKDRLAFPSASGGIALSGASALIDMTGASASIYMRGNKVRPVYTGSAAPADPDAIWIDLSASAAISSDEIIEGQWTFNRASKRPYVSFSGAGPATISPTGPELVYVDMANAAVVNLPSAAAWGKGAPLKIVNGGAPNTYVTVQRSGSDGIYYSGGSAAALWRVYGGQALLLWSNGSSTWLFEESIPSFGGRMYLQSNFVITAQANIHVGGGGSYWVSESDTSPQGNMLDPSGARMYVPISGYYSGRFACMYYPTTTDLGMLAWITTTNQTYSLAANVATGASEQGYGFTHVAAEASFDHVYLPAGTYLYPNSGWQYGGTGSHTIQGTAGAPGGADVTYMEMRFHGSGA